MKHFLKQHKTLWISMLITLLAAIMTATAVACAVIPAAGAQTIQTVAQAKGIGAGAGTEPDLQPTFSTVLATASPVPAPAEVSAEALQSAAFDTQFRRRFLIPVPDTSLPEKKPDDKIWNEVKIDETEWNAVVEKAKVYAASLFGQALMEPYAVFAYNDSTGYRPDIVQLRDAFSNNIITMDRKSLALINADTTAVALLPEHTKATSAPSTVNKDARGGLDLERSAEEREAALKVLDVFGLTQAGVWSGGSGYNRDQSYRQHDFVIETAEGPSVGVFIANNMPVSVGIFPDYELAREYVYFSADAYMPGGQYVTKVAVGNYAAATEAEILRHNEKNMTKEQAMGFVKSFYERFTGLVFSGTIEASGYLEDSGVREDYWHVELKGDPEWITMDLLAETGTVLKFNTGGLTPQGGRPKYDMWENAERVEELETEYEAVLVKMAPWYEEAGRGRDGSKCKVIELNAMHDDTEITVDITLMDGSTYEYHFSSGGLRWIEYYFSEDMDMPFNTQPADNFYQNRITGETFYYNGFEW